MPLLDHVLDVHGGRLRIGLTKSQVVEHLLVANIFVYCFQSVFSYVLLSIIIFKSSMSPP